MGGGTCENSLRLRHLSNFQMFWLICMTFLLAACEAYSRRLLCWATQWGHLRRHQLACCVKLELVKGYEASALGCLRAVSFKFQLEFHRKPVESALGCLRTVSFESQLESNWKSNGLKLRFLMDDVSMDLYAYANRYRSPTQIIRQSRRNAFTNPYGNR